MEVQKDVRKLRIRGREEEKREKQKIKRGRIDLNEIVAEWYLVEVII